MKMTSSNTKAIWEKDKKHFVHPYANFQNFDSEDSEIFLKVRVITFMIIMANLTWTELRGCGVSTLVMVIRRSQNISRSKQLN